MKRIELNNGLDYLEFREGSGRTIEIFDIAVRSIRRKGVGTNLIGQLLYVRTPKETKNIWAFVRSDNEGAIEFYQALGFKISPMISNFYAPGEHARIARLNTSWGLGKEGGKREEEQ